MRLPRLAAEDGFRAAVEGLAAVSARYHRAVVVGAGRIPAGPVLLVGNHGLFGLETLAFFWALREATGRRPLGLADRLLFGNAVTRPLLELVGGHVGTRDTALRLLREGQLVVCYPGGSREVFKAPGERYQLRWDGAVGFARVAIEARAPVVPFAGLGVDESWVNLGHLRAAKRLLGRYAAPLAFGIGLLPLPTRFEFVIGQPIPPPGDLAQAPLLKAAAERAVLELLASRGAHAVPEEPARLVP
jgi:1-acyl-sn-glycerol-3-phosphate acyltransferase